MKRWLLGLVGVAALIAGLVLALHLTSPMNDRAAAATFFEQTFVDADGTPQAAAQWRGQVVVVNFWATWCAPCIEEMPELERVHRDFRDRGATIVAIGIDSPAAIRAFRDELRLTMPLLIGGAAGSSLARELGNPAAALPYTVLVEKDGRIGQARLGRIHEAELRRWLNARLGAAG